MSARNYAAVLADKIKGLEKAYEMVLNPLQPFVVRLDGVSFKNFTAPLNKPFDYRFTKTMMLTTADLFDRTRPRTAFCQSDEITLVFPAEPTVSSMMYGGRVNKICSVIASMASARFNHHARSLLQNNDDSAWFDARVFSVPDDKTAMEAIWWRHKLDMRRNVINSIGHHKLGHARTDNLQMNELINKLRVECNVDPFNDFEPEAIYGVFFKKIQYNSTGYNPLTKETLPCVRTRVKGRTFDWAESEKERTEMVMDRFWQPHHPQSIKQDLL